MRGLRGFDAPSAATLSPKKGTPTMPTTQPYHSGQIYDPNDPPVGDAEALGTAYTNAGRGRRKLLHRAAVPRELARAALSPGTCPPTLWPSAAPAVSCGRSASMTGNIFTKTNALIGKKSYEKTRGLRWSRVFYANFLIALLTGLLTAVSTAAGTKLTTRYTGNIPARGRPCPCTNGRNTSVSRT